MSAVRLRITGRVQGVWFRASAKEKADELGITGWARNTEDGTVEILAMGEPDVLNEFTTWCRKGPPGARVEHVEEREEHEQKIVGFTIIH